MELDDKLNSAQDKEDELNLKIVELEEKLV